MTVTTWWHWRRLLLASETGSDPGREIAQRLAAGPRRGPSLLGIDGRSGSGKSHLAGQVCQNLDRHGLTSSVVVMDDLYEGWDGLAEAPQRLCTQVVEPMCAGTAATYHRYDWHVEAFTTVVTVPAADVVVIEGVGSTRHRRRDAFALTVWVQAPASVRHERACRRTGQGDFASHARSWAESEDALFGPDEYPHPPSGFDLVVDTVVLAASRRA